MRPAVTVSRAPAAGLGTMGALGTGAAEASPWMAACGL